MTKRPVIFFLLILLETLLLTVLRGKTGVYLSPVLIFLTSIFIGIYPLLYPADNSGFHSQKTHKTLIINSIILILFFILTIVLYKDILHRYPVDPQKSDIIPTVDILSKRFVSGEYPYKIINDYGYHLPPTYLPFHWFPFIISTSLNIDHRWIPLSFWIVSIIFYEFMLFKSLPGNLIRILASVLPFLQILIFILDFPHMFAVSIELLPASWYIWFSLALISRKIIFQSVTIALPLLSRFSFLLWLPVYAVSLLKEQKFKKILLFLSVVMIIIMFVYVLPFLSKDPESFQNGMKYYSQSAIGEWSLKDYQQENEKPVHLFRGVGFACFFYDFYSGNISSGIHALRITLLTIGILTSAVLIFLFLRKKEFRHSSLFLLAGLKISLTVFYSFIQVPYVYLQIVPVFISTMLYFSYLFHFYQHYSSLNYST